MKLNLNKGDYIFVKSFERFYDVLQVNDIYKNKEDKSIYKVNTLKGNDTGFINENKILGKVEIFDNSCDSIWELISK
ncbi:hypothetical protein LEQ06_09360 [Paraclostridium sp. AKS46]|nr:hypothetical protein [Paraclostridium sp. AKS46]